MGQQRQEQSAELCAAFAEFEAVSGKLTEFYASLEQRVAELTAELHESRAELQRELQAKDLLATRLESLLTALPGGIVVIDGAGRVQDFNPAAANLLDGLDRGTPWIEIVATSFAPRWDDGHDVSLKDGRRVSVATQSLHGEPGQILLITDVTETRRLQELLNHHRRLSAKTEMAASLAHQIRTPLSVAMLQVSNLSRATANPELRRRCTVKALDAMRQLERLVEDMLTFARGGTLEMSELEVGPVLEGLIAELAAAMPDSDFEVALGPVPPVRIRGNRSALHSIMLNLVNNGRAAAQGKGHLEISVRELGDYIQLRFADDGPGVPAADRENVFEPFFTTRRSGTGLGLSVARAVARAHGGELAIEPDYQDGACFVLSLPRLATAQAS
ncbi:MAG: PAS domain-containing sensor histidine kinase [Gammaproteobacteria bacterium]|nr:PAS domain-containing sensor histidine kinase [Gammaproteobacteria bacterium]MBI5615830.1 PAS domain-containing sensor histidine kinase [Gammaproteobacteria bacterium]